MFTKRFLFALIFVFFVLLAACTPAATAVPTALSSPVSASPTAVPSTEVPPIDTSEALSEAASLVQRYYDAVNVKDLDTAMSFIADDAVFINPTGSYTGKAEIRASLDGLMLEGITFELSNFRDTDGRVVYDYHVMLGDSVLETGTDGLTIVKDGMIAFDGTERTESSYQPPVPPDPITVVQSYFDALNAKDLDAVAALLDDDVRWRGTPYLTGKASVMSYVQGDINSGFTTEINDLRATRGRVTYTWEAFRNDTFQAGGEDTMVVENGKIVAIESYAVLGSDSRPEMTEIVFTASDTAFSGPDEIEGGWVMLTLTNEGQEGHHMQLVKLEEGKTLDGLNAALTANPEIFPPWAEPYGGPNAPDPGGTTSAILYLKAGSYALIDVIPNAEGVLHFQVGLLKALTVTEHAGIMPGEPKPDVTVILSDFNFGMDATPVAGEQTIRFRNAGSQVHEVFLVKLDDGKTADDYLNTPPGEIPPAVSLGGITGINSGDSQYIRLNLEPGSYAMFCFYPDPASHAPHFTLGMVLEFTVP